MEWDATVCQGAVGLLVLGRGRGASPCGGGRGRGRCGTVDSGGNRQAGGRHDWQTALGP